MLYLNNVSSGNCAAFGWKKLDIGIIFAVWIARWQLATDRISSSSSNSNFQFETSEILLNSISPLPISECTYIARRLLLAEIETNFNEKSIEKQLIFFFSSLSLVFTVSDKIYLSNRFRESSSTAPLLHVVDSREILSRFQNRIVCHRAIAREKKTLCKRRSNLAASGESSSRNKNSQNDKLSCRSTCHRQVIHDIEPRMAGAEQKEKKYIID